MNRDEIIADRQTANIEDVIDHGPRLTYNRSTWIVAKDPDAGMVYVGGLGCMGVGRMWATAHGFYKEDPTYADAPVWKCPEELIGN